ncbi:tyrosine-type recombinase/integrase [Nordella sp. HKS 07]|uniref:tyrosine-type recombinase/integrase n=1 Tax=Nordella sp. HKS 07 TaxID=2712222 RepID=UPI0013E1D418|nr:site-specific integrase [Nordella sp. HKS 07]QIG49447.1 tyrosine-type recombinase/integrase [Nordella sp. HKS 07]
MPEVDLKWTARGIEAISVKDRHDFTDTQTKGLTLRVTPNGAKSWALLYRRRSDGKRRRTTIGPWPEIGLAEARARAAELKVNIQRGSDPAGDVTAYKKADTVDQLLDQFLAHHPRPTAAWTQEVTRIFKKDVRPLIGSVKLPDLSRAHIRGVLDAVRKRGATVTVNRTLAAIRRALSWAVSKDLIDANPAMNMPTDIEERHKERALGIEEIRGFWTGLEVAKMSARSRIALRLVLVTGQRPGEVCGVRHDELDLENATWIIPAARTKNRKPHLVPLSGLAVELLRQAIELGKRGDYLFPSRPRSSGSGKPHEKPVESHALSHAMRGELTSLGLSKDPATPHDLRRTAASQMARLGIPDRIVGRVLNHGSELRRTITSQVYIHHDYAAEKRQALEAWASELERIFAGTQRLNNVVALGRRGE